MTDEWDPFRECILPKAALAVPYRPTRCFRSRAGSNRQPIWARRNPDGDRQRTICGMREQGRTQCEIADGVA